MSGFTRRRSGTIAAEFTDYEAGLLSDLAGQLASLMTDRPARGADPAVDRLLPDAYRQDAEFAAEFRRFTEHDLAAGKADNAALVADCLDVPADTTRVRVLLDEAGSLAWLRTLTDLRLVLAARIGIESDDGPPALDESGEALLSVYEWLGALQESLVRAVDREG